MTDNLYTGKEAREKMMTGIKKISDAVGATMGTSGNNSLIEVMERPGHYSTNDGYSIANAIKLADPIEEMGRSVLLEAINRANKQSGDGSSTTTVLTSAILEEGMKYIDNVSPMELKRSLERCIPVIEKAIKEQTKEITVDTVAPVASISAEDGQIGGTIQEIYQKIGKDGIIHWDISKTAEDSFTIGTGLTIHGATYASPYMCDIDESGTFTQSIRWKNPLIMLCRQKITSAAEFSDLFQSLFNQDKKELIIFTDEIEVPVIADLIRTRAVRGFKSVVIKMPTLWKDEWWQDLALASGATILDTATGTSLKNASQEHLGTFNNIIVDKEDTYIDGIKDMTLHIASLVAEGSEQSILRASRLNTKTARYFIGAHSESALAYRRLKVEDALNSASQALEGGIVAGGGIALLNASQELSDNEIGGIILKEALNAPFNKILKNAGIEQQQDLKENEGYDTRTGKIVDMFEANIIDPAGVVLNAVRNAIGVASAILTCGNIIIIPREEERSIQMPNAIIR